VSAIPSHLMKIISPSTVFVSPSKTFPGIIARKQLSDDIAEPITSIVYDFVFLVKDATRGTRKIIRTGFNTP